MKDFNLPNFINRFYAVKRQPPQNDFKTGQPTSSAGEGIADAKFQMSQEAIVKNIVQKNIIQNTPRNQFSNLLSYDFKMNHLENTEKSLYIKDLMNLPKEMEEMLLTLQNNTKSMAEVSKILSKNVNIATLAEMMQKNGKEAMNKLILTMAEASKQGITDTTQLKDAIKYINASVSVAGQDNPNLIIKNFMLMYLPWLPLREGVDFELEIESSSSGDDGEETSVTILISTVNYGNIKVTLILNTQNSIDILINCCEKFPKQELINRINGESKSHALQTTVSFEQNSSKPEDGAARQAKVSMSNLFDVNPFLLLMTNAVIRHTIELDNLAG